MIYFFYIFLSQVASTFRFHSSNQKFIFLFTCSLSLAHLFYGFQKQFSCPFMWTHHGCTSACVHGDRDDRLGCRLHLNKSFRGENCRGSCGAGRDFRRAAREHAEDSLGPEIIVSGVLLRQKLTDVLLVVAG